ncbi:hypothetical protein YC2023_061379 [Brassica napus]
MNLSGDKFTRPLGPNSSIANQIQTGTTILAANIRSQTRMFPKRRAKTNPLQHRETSSSPRTFQARNAAYERITNLQHRETSQTPEDSFFDEISFLDKNTFLEDQTVIRTNIFSKHILREDSKRLSHLVEMTSYIRHKDNSAIRETQNFWSALPGGLKIVLGEMLGSNHTSHISREPIADFKSVWNQDETETGYPSHPLKPGVNLGLALNPAHWSLTPLGIVSKTLIRDPKICLFANIRASSEIPQLYTLRKTLETDHGYSSSHRVRLRDDNSRHKAQPQFFRVLLLEEREDQLPRTFSTINSA